jgi:predicted transcriptional regulator
MTIQVVVPDALLERASQVATQQNLSVEELAALALEQFLEWERLKQRAARGSHERYLAFLDRVPNVPPDPADRL